MLITISIFVVIALAFIGILAEVTQVQVQTSSSAVVSQESQFLLQKLQYYIGTASLVDISTSTPTSTLKLYVASSSLDPTLITLASGTVYLQQPSGGSLQALTSNKVTVSNLSFQRRSNPPGHDTISVSYTLSYNTNNASQSFSQPFQTTIVKVSAATFDTGLYSAASAQPLGTSANAWSPINSVIYFNGTNVGINTASPAEQLSVQGGVQLLTTASSSITCNTTSRGTMLFYSPGGSVKDTLLLCAAGAGGTVGWQTIY